MIRTLLFIIIIKFIIFFKKVKMNHCGDSGIYGPVQSKWYLNERGLVWDSSETEERKEKSVPKEPTTGFQLFSGRIDTRRPDPQDDLGEHKTFLIFFH